MNLNRSLLLALLAPALLLLVPLVAMQFTNELVWTASDFVVAWVLLAGVGVALVWVAGLSIHPAYRAGAGLALLAALAVVWGNLAVGFIGSEGNPVNLLYAGVLAIGVLGGAWARFRPVGLARALLVTAVAQVLVPVVAVALDGAPFVGREWGVNAVFAVAFAAAGFLFRRAARDDKPLAQPPGS